MSTVRLSSREQQEPGHEYYYDDDERGEKGGESQIRALLAILEEITEMTKNPSIKGFIQTRKENMHLRNENEKMKKQNRHLVQQNAAKDKEITLLNARLNQQQVLNL
jgi:uncharacterized membrane protein